MSAKERKYPNVEDRGWSSLVEVNDVCGVSGVTFLSASVLHANVQDVTEQFVRYGTRYVLEALPFNNWHWAGEVWASLPCAQRDVKKSLAFLTALSNAAGSLGIYGLQSPPRGIIHGFIWQTVGDQQFSWQSIMDKLCSEPTFVLHWFCGHGVGHGFVIQCNGGHLAGRPYDNVSGSAFSCAIQKCNEAPSRGLAYICSHGVYHMLMTDAPGTFNFSSDATPRWMFPCDSWALPAFCFYYLFHDGLMAPWRALALASSELSQTSRRIIDVCAQDRMASDIHSRICIYGLSSRGFFTYFWTLRSVGSPSLQLKPSVLQQTCHRQIGKSFLPGTQSGRTIQSESIMCTLIFGHRFRNISEIVPNFGTPPTLFGWCSLLLNDDYSDENKWSACISGAVGFHHSFERANGTWCEDIDLATNHLGFVADVGARCKAAMSWYTNGIQYASILNEG